MPRISHKAAEGGNGCVLDVADGILADLRNRMVEMAALEAEAQAKIAAITAEYENKITPYREAVKDLDKTLIDLMKAEKKTLFAGGDVVNLPHGSLIRSQEWKVKIPRDAIGKCEELGFTDVVRIAKSLDREAVEKWPEEKLFLIGAERKPATKFSYEVKK